MGRQLTDDEYVAHHTKVLELRDAAVCAQDERFRAADAYAILATSGSGDSEAIERAATFFREAQVRHDKAYAEYLAARAEL